MPLATSLDGTRIHYVLKGSQGPWVVLLQGLGVSGRYWGKVADSLAESHRVLVVDNRGAGFSDKPVRPYTTERMADDVLAAIAHARAESPVVVGISMGGMIAQHVAVKASSRLGGALLIATSPGLPHSALPSPRALSMLARMPYALARNDRAAALQTMFFGTLPPEEAKALIDYLMETWGPIMLEDRMGPRDFFLQFAAAATHSVGFRLRRITCPVHVVTGADDIVVPPRNSTVLARMIAGATLEIVPRAGHALPAQDGEVVRRGIQRLQERRTGRSAA